MVQNHKRDRSSFSRLTKPVVFKKTLPFDVKSVLHSSHSGTDTEEVILLKHNDKVYPCIIYIFHGHLCALSSINTN